MKIGQAKYGGFTKKNYFKLKDGESTFRILPPMGTLADSGRWSMFYKIHYGYKNTSGKLRIFQSSLVTNNKTKMIEVPDAANQRILELKSKLEKAKADGQKAIVEKLGPLVSGAKPVYNLDANHYLNVIDKQGNIGILKLRHRAKTALDVVIKKLQAQGIDPLSVENGRFFTFTRTGTGLDTSFAVEVAQERLNVQGVGDVSRDIVHVLSPELINRLAFEAADLSNLYRSLSAADIERIVASSDLLTGISPVIDEIFDKKEDGSVNSEEEYDDSGDYEPTPLAAVQASSADSVKTMTKAVAAATVQIEKLQTAIAAPKVTKAPPTMNTAEALDSISDQDFLKSLGL